MSVERGYTTVILNHLVPKYDSTLTGMRLLDFGDADTMHEIFNFVKANFEQCNQIFAIGYSLGGCYVLKSVGAANAENQVVDFKAIATVGQSFDVLSTG